MKILEKEFKYNGFLFTQVVRLADKAVYKKRNISGKAVSFEVIRIKSHNGYEIGGVKIAPSEVYPSSSQWGTFGWTYTKLEDAMNKYFTMETKAAVRVRTRPPQNSAVRVRARIKK
jgi:hypothetical protein